MTRHLLFGLLLLAAPAWADDRPFVHSPSGPGVDRGALSLGVAGVFSTEGGAMPLAQVHYVRGMSRHIDLTAEVDTMGLFTLGKAGARLKVGERLSAAIGAEGGGVLIVLPDFFGETAVYAGGVLSPSLALGVSEDSVAGTIKGEVMFVLSGAEPVAIPRVTAVLEVRVGQGALSLGGGLMLDVEGEDAFPLVMAGWIW